MRTNPKLAGLAVVLFLRSICLLPGQVNLTNVGHITFYDYHTNFGAQTLSLAVSGHYAFLANAQDGFRILDISDAANPVSVFHTNEIAPFGTTYAVAVSGNYAYLACYDQGLRIYGVSDPTNTVSIAHTNPPGISALNVAIRGSYAYLISQDGLRIFEVSDPAHPAMVGYAQVLAGTANGAGVAVLGNYAYTAGDAGFWVYNVANPANPFTIAHATDLSGATPLGIAVSGHIAYEANSQDGLRIYDVSTPAYPICVGYVGDQGSTNQAFGSAVTGAYAYLANGFDGLRVYNVTDPTNPVNIGHASNPTNRYQVDSVDFEPGFARRVAVSGNYAYIANGLDGLRIYSLAPPLNISSTATNMVLISWIALEDGPFALQENPDLGNGTWTTLTNAPVVSGSSNQVLVPKVVGNRFYRLVSQ